MNVLQVFFILHQIDVACDQSDLELRCAGAEQVGLVVLVENDPVDVLQQLFIPMDDLCHAHDSALVLPEHGQEEVENLASHVVQLEVVSQLVQEQLGVLRLAVAHDLHCDLFLQGVRHFQLLFEHLSHLHVDLTDVLLAALLQLGAAHRGLGLLEGFGFGGGCLGL